MAPREAIRILECVRAEDYEAALGIGTADSREAQSRAHLVLCHRFRGQGRLIEALNRAHGALSRESALDRGRRLFRLGRTLEALPFLCAAVGAHSAADDCHALGQSLCHAQKHAQAVGPLHRAAVLRGTAEDYVWLGGALERSGRLDEAEMSYRRSVALRGGADDHLLIGQLLLSRGRYREAAPFLREAVAGDSEGVARELLDRCRYDALRAAWRQIACALARCGSAGAPPVRIAAAFAAAACLALGEPLVGSFLVTAVAALALASPGGGGNGGAP